MFAAACAGSLVRRIIGRKCVNLFAANRELVIILQTKGCDGVRVAIFFHAGDEVGAGGALAWHYLHYIIMEVISYNVTNGPSKSSRLLNHLLPIHRKHLRVVFDDRLNFLGVLAPALKRQRRLGR